MGDEIQRKAEEVSTDSSEISTTPVASQNDHHQEKFQTSGGVPDRALATLDSILYPSDIYTSNHTYWADLPAGEKTKWINNQNNAQAKQEVKQIGRMFKEDPLSPIRFYFSNYVVKGMGLFVEGYVLFSVGNLSPLFKAVWPACWKSYTECEVGWIHAVDYLEIIGIIVGQVLVGIEGDWIGRRFGMVQDALVMTLGSIMLTAMWGNTLNGWVICYAFSLFIYGIGVGGEYPMTSTQAMETVGQGSSAAATDRLTRGRRVALAFTMQGWGQLFNQGVLIILLLIFNSGSLNSPYSKTTVQWTFRLQFAVIILPTLYLAYLRFYKMRYVDAALRQAKGKTHTSGYNLSSLKLAGGHYWHRMIGTALVWFINDVVFYGSKIFSSVFIQIITGTTDVKPTYLYNLLNIGISLVGYYLAAILIDHKQYGRKWMQANGLLAIGVIFTICYALYPQLTGSKAGAHAFMALYFLSSFFTQFGPNTTSFLLAAEVYPASVRSTAHGLSAATGKMGALLAAVYYNYIGSREKFLFVFPWAFGGWALTLIFIPDTTGLDLREQERYFGYVLRGEQENYHGIAIHPRHLSLFERVVLRRHLQYDPELDRNQKIDELRQLYTDSKQVETEKETSAEHMSDDHKDLFDHELDGFFANESKLQGSPTKRTVQPSKLAELEGRLR
ncbi:hypothetical protein CBS101457_005137 [Exobasidium rhododendri]|nr:hypothetical protein CBS101457_005137 [Exobasidium rhododendri]